MMHLSKNSRKGFTLIEMLVSIGIFAIISAVVIFNHGKFNSSIVVTNLSYEVAAAVREAQVYGLAVRQNSSAPDESVEYAYGVYFSMDNPHVFYIFADSEGDDQQFDPTNDPCDGTKECLERIEIRGDVEIKSLKTRSSTGTRDANEVTILFLRPNPVAIIRDEGNSGASSSGRQQAVIELHSDRADKSKEIVVELSGQVSVQDPE